MFFCFEAPQNFSYKNFLIYTGFPIKKMKDNEGELVDLQRMLWALLFWHIILGVTHKEKLDSYIQCFLFWSEPGPKIFASGNKRVSRVLATFQERRPRPPFRWSLVVLFPTWSPTPFLLSPGVGTNQGPTKKTLTLDFSLLNFNKTGIDAQKMTLFKTLTFFGLCSNFLAKSDKK